jgi:hypothetical protein
MTAEFGPYKLRKWLQRVFYLAVALGIAVVIVGEYMK